MRVMDHNPVPLKAAALRSMDVVYVPAVLTAQVSGHTTA